MGIYPEGENDELGMVYIRFLVRSAGKLYGCIHHFKKNGTLDKEERIDGTFKRKMGRNMG